MDPLFRDKLNIYVYLDDTIVASSSIGQHTLEHLYAPLLHLVTTLSEHRSNNMATTTREHSVTARYSAYFRGPTGHNGEHVDAKSHN